EHAVEEVERPEQAEVPACGPVGEGRRYPGPQGRSEVQRVVVEIQLEQPEQVTLGVLEARDVTDGHHRHEQGRIGEPPLANGCHGTFPLPALRQAYRRAGKMEAAIKPCLHSPSAIGWFPRTETPPEALHGRSVPPS